MKYLFLLLVVSVTFALPQPAGYVNDYGNILTNGAMLEQELIAYERNTTIEIALVTLDSVPPDQTLFTYGVELFDQWGIGKKGEDNGILVLLVKNGTTGNRMRIELGYGIQGYITGGEAGRILDEAMPYYQAGDYQTTAEVIIAGLKAQLVNYTPGAFPSLSQPPIEFSLMFSSITVLVFAGFLYAFLKSADSDRSKKTIKVLLVLLPFLWILSLLSVIAMLAVSLFGILSIIIGGILFLRPKCPRCKSTKIVYSYRSDSPVVNCECKKCGKKWRKRQPGYYRNGVFIAYGGGNFGGGGFGGGGFGGGASGGGGAGR